MAGTANLFVDWSAPFHKPTYQACDGIPVEPDGTTTVQMVLNNATTCQPPITYSHIGDGPNAYLIGIDGVEQNADQNGFFWVYLVNGVSPEVGFAKCPVYPGDSVVWDYKHFSSGLFQANHPDFV